MQRNDLLLGVVILFAVGVFTGFIKPGAVGASGTGTTIPPSNTCVLAAAQTIQGADYNSFNQTLVGAATNTYINPSTGQLNPSNGTTQPNTAYVVYFAPTGGYFGQTVPITTGCSVTAPVTASTMLFEQSFTTNSYVLNNDGLTKNYASPGTGTANETSFGANTLRTFTARLSAHAAGTHLVGPLGKFDVYVNATNSTQWDLTGGANAPGANIAFNGVPCSAYTEPYNPASLTGVVIYKATCTGDIPTNGFGSLTVGVKTLSLPAGATNVGVNIVPWDYFVDSSNGKLSTGGFNNVGTAVQTAQSLNIGISS